MVVVHVGIIQEWNPSLMDESVYQVAEERGYGDTCKERQKGEQHMDNYPIIVNFMNSNYS